jgi:amino acid adenylation domain-containing protein
LNKKDEKMRLNESNSVVNIVYDFIIQLRLSYSAIWMEGEVIKVVVAPELQNDATKEIIKSNKAVLTTLLRNNKIFSKDDFNRQQILSNLSDVYPLSSSQERLWFLEQFQEGMNAYNVPTVYELDERTSVEAVQYALKEIIMRHEVLRTCISETDGIPSQVVYEHLPTFNRVTIADGENVFSTILQEVNRPFNLTKEYPIRTTFYVVKEGHKSKRFLAITVHHIACDGWSGDIFLKELLHFFEEFKNPNATPALAPLAVQFKDFALWQRTYLKNASIQQKLQYWVKKLSGYQTLNFPIDKTRPAMFNYSGGRVDFVLGSDTRKRVDAMAKRCQVTPNSILLGGFNILLSRYCGQNDIVVGHPVANRQNWELELMIGFFSNMVVSRTCIDNYNTFEELIRGIHNDQVEAHAHQDIPFETVVDALQSPRDTSRHPLFQVTFVVENFGAENRSNDGIRQYLRPVQLPNYDTTQFDLAVRITDAEDKFVGVITYATTLFTQERMQQLADHYVYLLEKLLHEPGRPHTQISLLDEVTAHRILHKWNETKVIYPKARTLHSLFSQQARSTPEQIALVYEGQRLSYKELDDRSNALAAYLINAHYGLTNREIAPDTFFALCLDKGLEMIVGILAILKTGGAYVPIDPQYPQARIEFILNDSNALILLSNGDAYAEIKRKASNVNVINIALSEDLYTLPAKNIISLSASSDLAYVIYTSGTTGHPKGVMVTHAACVNTIDFLKQHYIDVHHATLFTSCVFDVSVSEIFTPLLLGKQLHILSETTRTNIDALSTYLNDNQINLCYLPPVVLAQLPRRDYSDLKTIIYAGEPCNKETAIYWSGVVKLFNYYGPTEASIYATAKRILKDEVNEIGTPIQNTKTYILDSKLLPVPVGVPGELYISGAGLARGYLNNAELTSIRFLPNPFVDVGDTTDYGIMYKTGDLVRWRADGNIEFLGRNDEQVKVRGFRVEILEVENAMRKISGIEQACAIARRRVIANESFTYLIGYYVTSSIGQLITEEEIAADLRKSLPDYMIPEAFVQIAAMPTTVNGKLDKNALPEPKLKQDRTRVQPSTKTEENLCNVWNELLGLDCIGLTDDFFRSGGNSILAMRASYRMTLVVGTEVKVADIFKHRTIAGVLSNVQADTVKISKVEGHEVALSFSQQRLWFVEQYYPGKSAYHLPSVLELTHDTNIDGLKFAVNTIIARHEVLRTVFVFDAGQTVQRVLSSSLQIEEVSVASLSEFDIIVKNDAAEKFDLSTSFPIRVKFYHVSGRRFLLINIHHVAVDHWSFGIFKDELLAIYTAYVKKSDAVGLAQLPIQYKDFANWQHRQMEGERAQQQLDYWTKLLEHFQPLALPLDFPRPAEVDFTGSYEKFLFSQELSNKLKYFTKEYGITLHAAMLSGLTVLLSKYAAQDDVVIGMPTANRTHRHTEPLIGCFVNMLVHRVKLNDTDTFEDLVEQTHRLLTSALEFQELPFEKLVDSLRIDRDTSMHPVFQVTFEVQSSETQNNNSHELVKLLTPVHNIDVAAKYDLSFSIEQNQNELLCHVIFATKLFKLETIRRLVSVYQQLLVRLLDQPCRKYASIPLTTPELYHDVITAGTARWHARPVGQTIHALFEEQARQRPEQIAVYIHDTEYTYKEVNEWSNQVARQIQAEYIRVAGKELLPDTLIPLYFNRGIEMVIGILAVLKVGGAYVPIDPEYPADRIAFIVRDTNSCIAVAQKNLPHSVLVAKDRAIINIEINDEAYRSYDPSNLDATIGSTNLAYVIYTSGTTGDPKGVMIEHSGVINLINNQVEAFEITPSDVVLQFASYGFDASVSEIFTALCAGAQLLIASEKIRQDPGSLLNFLEVNNVTVATIPPTLLSTLEHTPLPKLKTLVVAGEVCPLEVMKRWKEDRLLINAYGPTEITVCASLNKFDFSDSHRNIGKPLNNVSLYVLDQYLNPMPTGFVGELYIGGAGVARGYLNNAELTAKHFIKNAFDPNGPRSQHLYKTGDLAKWNDDGTLEFLGRRDDQVKIRGHRIELGEIESALLKVEGISNSCVVVRDRATANGTVQVLIAFYMCKSESFIPSTRIRSHLELLLPAYMIPAEFVEVKSFPYTQNGKLDKKGFSEADFSSQDISMAPTSSLERVLCKIFADVLGVSTERIGIHDNFFHLGGNSIVSIQLRNRLTELPEFRNLTIADIFRYNTIQSLTKLVYSNEPSILKNDNISSQNNQQIAIIGISGAFGGANNLDDLWKILIEQKEGTKFYNHDECRQLEVEEILLSNPAFIPVAGKIANIDFFDPYFWGMSPAEAMLLDPQIRKFVEHCWKVLENAGYAGNRKQQNIGVFAGSGDNQYYQEHIFKNPRLDNVSHWDALTSNSKDSLATKVAYLLDLCGPAYSINTACSTSLVSIVEACYKLNAGACSMALAGGVSLSMPHQIGYVYQEGMIASRDGHCRPFDADASGTIYGSGVGVVLLKRLDEAVKDGDKIYAVIKGFATNNDGAKKAGYITPSVTGQAECILRAQKMANVTSDQIDYLECHGTGTRIGDAIEVQAIKEAFDVNKGSGNSRNTILGSIKANIGHTDAAAGAAGIIKLCVMLENNMMPGQANFSSISPDLQLHSTNLDVLKVNRDWGRRQPNVARFAAVSSFGIGGTNAHVILSDYVSDNTNETEALKVYNKNTIKNPEYVIPISAKDSKSLGLYRKALTEYLTIQLPGQNALRDLAFTLQEKRQQFTYRSSYCVSSIGDLLHELTTNKNYTRSLPDNKIVFMFPGQGTQYVNMARSLYETEDVFKYWLNECFTIASQHLDVTVHEVLYPTEKSVYDIHETKWAQVTLFSVEYALARLLEHLGIKADAFIGHSVGEFVAATLSGVFSLEDAVHIVIVRGQLMHEMTAGSMLAVKASEDAIASHALTNNCEIAVINSEEDVVISGTRADIQKLRAQLESGGFPCVMINTSHAYHCGLMTGAAEAFVNFLIQFKLNIPLGIFASNITGEVADANVTDPKYWGDHIRKPVRFADGIDNLSELFLQHVTFIEVGPGKALHNLVKKYAKKKGSQTMASIQLLASQADVEHAHNTFDERALRMRSRLWDLGLLSKANTDKSLQQATITYGLPGYQFNYRTCWYKKRDDKTFKKFSAINASLYKPTWKRSELLVNADISKKRQCALIFFRDTKFIDSHYQNLQDLLRERFASVNCCYHHYNSTAPYHLDFSDDVQFRNFLDGVHAKDIDFVLYVSSTTELADPTIDALAVRQLFGWVMDKRMHIGKFVSLTYDNFDVLGTETLVDRPSIIPALSKSIPIEFDSYCNKALHIDVSADGNITAAEVVTTMLGDYPHDMVALRGKYVWYPSYEPTKAKNLDVSKSLPEATSIVITGGLGAVGSAFASTLKLSNQSLKLIIIGRTAEHQLSDHHHRQLAQLREHHTVLYLSLDMGDQTSSAVLLEFFERNGIRKIDLIIHAAGVVSNNADRVKSREEIEKILLPKIVGIETLVGLAEYIKIDRLITCSSMASILPSIGNMEYTAANFYMDEVCNRKHLRIDQVLALNINHVADSGQGFDFINKVSNNSLVIRNSITTSELSSLLMALAHEGASGTIALSRYDLESERVDSRRTAALVETDETEKVKRVLETDCSKLEHEAAVVFAEVLGMDEISIHDDFFKLGGNSMLSIQAAHRLNALWNTDLSVADIFKNKNVAGLVSNMSSSSEITIPRCGKNKVDISFAQERLLFIEQYQQGTNAYHMPVVWELGDDVNIECLKSAIQMVVKRHEVLRSHIVFEDGKPKSITKDYPLAFEHIEVHGWDRFEHIIKEHIDLPFDLSAEYPIRVRFYSVDTQGKRERSRLALVNIHHIACDGWSMDIIEEELINFYEAFRDGDESFELREPEIQYKDYAVWQRGYLNEDTLTDHLAFWKDRLAGFDYLDFPTDYRRPRVIDYRGAQQKFTIPQITATKLKNLARQHGVTMQSVLLSALSILLGRYTRQSDIVTGTPTANRNYRQTKDVVGFFVNMLVNRTMLQQNQTFLDLVKRVHEQHAEAQMYQHLPFEKLVDELQVERDTSRHPLFQIMFVVQSFGNAARLLPAEREYLKPYLGTIGYAVEKFDISIYVDDRGDSFNGNIVYATSLFKPETIERLEQHFTQLLSKLADCPELYYSQHTLLGEEEFNKVVHQWNIPASTNVFTSPLHRLFEQQVLRTPTNVAITYKSDSLTYQDINRKSNQLANIMRADYLQKTGCPLPAGTLVGLLFDRGPDMIIAILAVLKAGAAYVPIDPTNPKERIDFILEDANATVLITSITYAAIPTNKGNMCIHIVLPIDLTTADEFNLPEHAGPDDLAYVIYTSGTTGKPKGAMVEHRNVSRLFSSTNNLFGFNQTDVWTLFHSYAFDFSVWEIWGALLYGGRLVVVTEEDARDTQSFYDLCVKENISVLNQTPSAFYNFIEAAGYADAVPAHLRFIIFGGEALNTAMLQDWWNFQEANSLQIRLINMYGITETTVHVTYKELESGEIQTLSVGKRLPDLYTYILDQQMNPVPIGVIGELFIGGDGVCRGYLNKPELTAEKFITDFLSSDPGKGRLYRTGDLARWNDDGEIEYIGRNDHQVKIRGYRIELAEVEAALSGIPAIKQCAVVVKEKKSTTGNGGKYLAAYYVLNTGVHVDRNAEILQSWENVYDSEYQKNTSPETIEEDFSGWNSYVTGAPIPLAEMRAWKTDILNAITNLRPSQVLEIGVGSGILMYPLLQNVKRFVGIDISSAVIDRHKTILREKRFNVDLYHCKADEINRVSVGEKFDLIIINSVAQYFPNIAYFNTVLNKALQRLLPNGHIFIGDIRNNDLLKDLVREKLQHSRGQFSDIDVDHIALKENELMISPQYFTLLAEQSGGLQVQLLTRENGCYSNELSKYRYDVIIGRNGQWHNSNFEDHLMLAKGHGALYNLPYLNQLSREDIVQHLSMLLPGYFIPEVFVQLNALPLNINGKLDRGALPDPEFRKSDGGHQPQTEIERAIAQVWEEVLGVNAIGVRDDFFKIGGNSILAIQVSHRMSKVTGRDFKVADIFRYKTISSILHHNLPRDVQAIYPTADAEPVLSFAQERLWFIEQYEGGTYAYHIPAIFELAESANIDALKFATQKIISRHDILRTVIRQGKDYKNVQIVSNKPFHIDIIKVEEDESLSKRIKEDLKRPFDLAEEFPIRVRFYHTEARPSLTASQSKRILVTINIHHIACDGWSMQIFQNELNVYYEAFASGNLNFELPALPIQYKDFAVWQKLHFTEEVVRGQLTYWKNKLSGYQSLELPKDFARPKFMDYRGAQQQFKIPADISEKLRALARAQGVTMHSVLLSSVSILLAKYSGQKDIVVGSPIANRHYKETEGLIGFFVNMQVNRIILEEHQSFEDLVLATHAAQVAAQSNQDLPFERLVDELEGDRDRARHPVIQVTFEIQNFSKNTNNQSEREIFLKPFQEFVPDQAVKYDLSIFIDDSGSEFLGQFNYAISLFRSETIGRMIDRYIYLLSMLADAPKKLYSQLSIASSYEIDILLQEGKGAIRQQTASNGCVLHELFAKQAEKTGSKVAVIYEQSQITYSELHSKSTQLAQSIREEYKRTTGRDLKREDLIPIFVDRSLEAIIGILAILKAGGCYVPIDPTYPASRIEYIIRDTKSEVVLTLAKYISHVAFDKKELRLIPIDLMNESNMVFANSELPESGIKDLAYIIYTSGTTGIPKGVMVEHGAVSNTVLNQIEMFNISADDHVMQFASYGFDASVSEIFTTLAVGATLVVVPEDVRKDPRLLCSFIDHYKINVGTFPPSFVASMPYHELPSLRTMVFAGEASSIELFDKWINGRKIINAYGPTETAVCASMHEYRHGDVSNNIGKALTNVSLYVLDETLNPVAHGAVGELYVAGAGLSRGYLNKPELTKDRFFENPFASMSEKALGYNRLYKTGDMVRWLSNECLQYIGRNDEQAKVRGYRIEPAEIEHALMQVKGVKQSCVVIKDLSNGISINKAVIGYYVPEVDGTAVESPTKVKDALLKILPEYLVPDLLVPVSSFPLTFNGKIDKRSLPEPEVKSEDYIAPTNEIEVACCQIWQEALKVERVGITDDFFKLGGNSILAIQVSYLMSETIETEVTVADVFDLRNIKALVAKFSVPNTEGQTEWNI